MDNISNIIENIITYIVNLFHIVSDTEFHVTISIYTVIILSIVYVVIRLLDKKGVLGVVGNIVGYIPTIIHEFGHVIIAKLFLGRVDDIVLIHRRKNQELHQAYGYAVTYNKGRIINSIKAYFGYLSPPLVVLGIIYLNSINALIIALIVAIAMTLYLLYKTSNKLPIIINLILLLVISYLFIGVGETVLLGIVVNVVLGLLLGETFYTLIILPTLIGNDKWDGAVIKDKVYIPQFLSVVIWYVFIVGILYLTLKILI